MTQQDEILTCVYYRRCFYFCDSYMQTDDGFSQKHPANKTENFSKVCKIFHVMCSKGAGLS